jgi:hypothetical protein
MIRKTIEKTAIYKQPTVDLRNPEIHVLPNRSFEIKKLQQVVNPFDGNKEELFVFGQVVGGWLLVEKNYYRYVEQGPLCPICYDELEACPDLSRPSKLMTLPCCQKKIHGECWYNQVKSFDCEGGLYSETHSVCPYCRKNYWDTQRYYYSWTGSQFYNTYCDVPGFNCRQWRSHLRKVIALREETQKLLKEKDNEVEPEEQGGWALFICKTCKKPHIPGKLSCAEELNLDLSKKDFECDECKWARSNTKDHRCFIHGKKYAMFKCDSCCSLATWDCFSNHYCDRCHRNASGYKNYPCPGKDKCPLGIAHPPNSHGVHQDADVGFVVGCAKCLDPNYEVNQSYSENAPDPFRARDLDNNENIQMFQYAAPPSKEEIAKLKKEFEEKQLAMKLENERLEKELLTQKLAKENYEKLQKQFLKKIVEKKDPAQAPELEKNLNLEEDEEISVDFVGFNLFYDSESEEEEEEEEYEDIRGFHLFDSSEDEEDSEQINVDLRAYNIEQVEQDDNDLIGFHLFDEYYSSVDENIFGGEDEEIDFDLGEQEEEENSIDLVGFDLFYDSEEESEESDLDLKGFDLFPENESETEGEEEGEEEKIDLQKIDIFDENEEEGKENMVDEMLDLIEISTNDELNVPELPVIDENLLGLFAPPMMVKRSSCCSLDSVLSEDTLNLLNFNKGFGHGSFVEAI